MKKGVRTASKTIGDAIEWHGNIVNTLVDDPENMWHGRQLIGIVWKVVVDNHGYSSNKIMHSHFFSAATERRVKHLIKIGLRHATRPREKGGVTKAEC